MIVTAPLDRRTRRRSETTIVLPARHPANVASPNRAMAARTMRAFSILLPLLLLAACASAPQAPSRRIDLPDPALTPGAADPRVTQANIATTICVPGYARAVRPPASFTSALKRRQVAARGLPGSTQDYEEDHLIPLELGGAPNDESNLWPEPWAGPWGARVKDRLENRLHRLVCAGDVPLDRARRAVATNWIDAWTFYSDPVSD
jgi:hypothetical protein